MFAGKSSAVISRVRRAEVLGWKTFVITSSADTRYTAESKIITHDRASMDATGATVLKGLEQRSEYAQARLVIIEEGQFFTDLYDFVVRAVEEDGKDVVVVGLDGDSDRKPFGDILRLIPLADKVERLTSLCKRCGDGTPGLFSALVRGSKGGEQVFVGGSDSYEAMCRKHYKENSLRV
jgi:thymidine kinase